MTIKVGVLGSAFSPPTLGHLSLIEQFNQFDEVWLIPSFSHAFGKNMYPYSFRLSLLQAFAQDINQSKGYEFVVCKDIESKISSNKTGPIYTFDVLSFLQSELGESHKFSFIAGPDNKEGWSKFYNSEKILDKWEVVFGLEFKAIRSTLVRELIATNKDFSSLVTSGVHEILINSHITQEEGIWSVSPKEGVL